MSQSEVLSYCKKLNSSFTSTDLTEGLCIKKKILYVSLKKLLRSGFIKKVGEVKGDFGHFLNLYEVNE